MAAWLALSVNANAQAPPPRDVTSLSLDELMNVEVETVYGASNYVQKIVEAPASVSIVTADEIRVFGYRTLADIVRSVRGFYIYNDRNYDYVGARGFARPGDYNSRILLLVDGHPLNNNVYGQALIGPEFPLDVDLIDRVEIIRGTSSSIYGTSAFFGVVNVVTRTGAGVGGVEAASEAGSLATYRARATYGARTPAGLDVLLSGSAYSSGGQRRLYFAEYDDPAHNAGVAQDLDGQRSASAFGRLSYRGFTIEGLYGSREKHVPTAAFDSVFNDPRFLTTDRHAYVNGRFERRLGPRTEVMAGLAFDSFRYSGFYPVDRGSFEQPALTLNPDLAEGDWLTGETKLSQQLGRHLFTAGADVRQGIRQHQTTYDDDPYIVYLDDRRRLRNWGLYLQDDFPIARWLLASAGLRYDHYQTFGATVNPRAALIFSPGRATVIKVLSGTAYRAPNAYELFYTVPGQKANPALKPETIASYEIGVEQRPSRRLRLGLSLFRNRISRLISQGVDDTDGELVFRNIDDASAQGVEAEIDARWAAGVQLHGAWSYQRAEHVGSTERMINSPAHLGKVSALVPIGKRTMTGIELQWVGARRTLGGAEAAGYGLVNVTVIRKRVLKGLDFTVGACNLFDTRYADPGSDEHRQDVIWQNGRQLRAGFVYRFTPWK